MKTYYMVWEWTPKGVIMISCTTPVADPGFDLRGGVDFVNGGWGGLENH